MSMIELVISIVVMGIVAAGIPMILQQSQSSVAINTIRQENTLIAKAQLWRILSYPWSPNSFSQTDQKSYILTTASPNTNGALNAKAGLTAISGRRAFKPIGDPPTNAAAITNIANIANVTSINGFHNLPINIQVGTRIGGGLTDAGNLNYTSRDGAGNAVAVATATVGYFNDQFPGVNFNNQIINITINPANLNVNPQNAASSSNIKVIRESVNSGVDIDGDTVNETIVMFGFASNVGESLNIDPRGL